MSAISEPSCLQAIGAENGEIANSALLNLYDIGADTGGNGGTGVINNPDGTTTLVWAYTNDGTIFLPKVFYDPSAFSVASPTYGNVTALQYFANVYNLPNLTAAQLQAIILVHEAGHVIAGGFPNDANNTPQSEANTAAVIKACFQ